MDILVLLGGFTVLCALGVPVAYALGLSALLGALWIDIPLEAVMLRISDGTDDFVLLAIPFFVLAGGIMAEGGMAARLVMLAKVFFGVIRGGLALGCRIASFTTHSVSGAMRPLGSASEMKASGIKSPRSGCCQRTRASTPNST